MKILFSKVFNKALLLYTVAFPFEHVNIPNKGKTLYCVMFCARYKGVSLWSGEE
jgi:hypothetical protein